MWDSRVNTIQMMDKNNNAHVNIVTQQQDIRSVITEIAREGIKRQEQVVAAYYEAQLSAFKADVGKELRLIRQEMSCLRNNCANDHQLTQTPFSSDSKTNLDVATTTKFVDLNAEERELIDQYSKILQSMNNCIDYHKNELNTAEIQALTNYNRINDMYDKLTKSK